MRSMTRHLARRGSVEPSCLLAWAKRIGELPKDIGERYNTRLLTPRDWASHFKNILHRALLVRSISTEEPCRCCRFARENIQHFADCEAAGELFKNFKRLTESEVRGKGEEWQRFCLFALLPKGKIKEGWINLHLLLWKQLVAQLVRIELEGEKYSERDVWAAAWARMKRKIEALKTRVDEDVRRAEARGDEPKDMTKRSRPMEPLASFDKEGKLTWNEKLVKSIEELAKDTGRARACAKRAAERRRRARGRATSRDNLMQSVRPGRQMCLSVRSSGLTRLAPFALK